jgi:hypothetical protein
MILANDRGPIDWEMTLPVAAKGAAAFCKYHQIDLQPEGRAMLRAGLSTKDYFATLWENGLLADARRVLANALPPRRSLWWGLLCAWNLYRPSPTAEVDEVLQAVVRFVLQPTEVHRRAAAASARAVELNSLAACLANAAFFSAGSMAPEGLPCVEPQPFITGRLVGVTVYLASVMQAPIAEYQNRLRQYLAVGLEIACGANLWPDCTPIEPVAAAPREWVTLKPTQDEEGVEQPVAANPAELLVVR